MLHKNTPYNISETIQIGSKILHKYSPTSNLDSEILLAFIFSKNKEYLYSNFKDIVSQVDYKRFLNLIKKRKQRLPIAYIVGKKEFYGHMYSTTKGVLIPRPETEEIIEIALRKIKEIFKSRKHVNILEIGSGTGCIPITLKSILKSKISILSFEISKKAYSQTIRNFHDLDPGKINFKNMDAFQNIPKGDKFDFIISNPPYLASSDMLNLSEEVRFEPKKALYGGTDGLLYYRKLYLLLKKSLKKKGVALFEINEKLGLTTAAIFQKEYSCEIIKDTFNKDRFIFISHQ